MLLDIIIPQYNEDENVIKYLLNSINNQKDVDFSQVKITIVNDCSNVKLSDSFLNSFNNLNISYIENDKNTGPGLARQKGIDNTNSDFIMFCDSDDELYDLNSLHVITDFISKYEPLYLVTNIVVEIGNEGKYIEIKKGKDTYPWMHGKVYKRSFLNENDIRFHPLIRHLEDSYFTTSILGVIDPKKIAYLDYATYRWKNNNKSLTRDTKKYSYAVNTFDDFFNSPLYTYEFLSKKNSKMKFNYIISSIFAIYIVLNSDLFNYDELKEKREFYLNKLNDLIKTKRNLFVIFGREKLEKIYDIQYNEIKKRNGIKEVYKDLDNFYYEYLN